MECVWQMVCIFDCNCVVSMVMVDVLQCFVIGNFSSVVELLIGVMSVLLVVLDLFLQVGVVMCSFNVMQVLIGLILKVVDGLNFFFVWVVVDSVKFVLGGVWNQFNVVVGLKDLVVMDVIKLMGVGLMLLGLVDGVLLSMLYLMMMMMDVGDVFYFNLLMVVYDKL